MIAPTIEQIRSVLSAAKEPLRLLFDPPALRKFAANTDLPVQALRPDVPIGKTSIGGIACERFGAAASGAVLLYLHGGGFMLPPTNAYRLAIQKIAGRLNIEALMPRYRLAPEHPFPAALQDCLAVYAALASEHRSILLAGDSAGGGLALSLVLRARAERLKLPTAIYLISPFTDLAFTGESLFTKAAIDPILTPEALLHKAYHYLNGQSPTDPLASAFYGELSGLPPTLIHVGSDEILLDDSVRFATRARSQGSAVECHVHSGMPHIFPTIPFVAECEQALAAGAEFLACRLPEPH